MHCHDGRGALYHYSRCARSDLILSPFSKRLLGFGGCLLGAAVCFFVAFLTLPFLAIRPAKFALSFRCVCLQQAAHPKLISLLPSGGAHGSLGSLLVMFGCARCILSGRDTSSSPTGSPSFSVLIGPINHLKHLCSKERLPFSFVFLSSLALTLYFSLGVRVDPDGCALQLMVLHLRDIPSSGRCRVLSFRFARRTFGTSLI